MYILGYYVMSLIGKNTIGTPCRDEMENQVSNYEWVHVSRIKTYIWG